MIDQGPQRRLLMQLEIDMQAANIASCAEEINIKTRHAAEEVRAGLRHSLDAYAGLQYCGEDDPEIRRLPPEVRDSERRIRNLPLRKVVDALEYCRKNPRINGEALKKLRDTKFKNWPVHLSIEVIPDLLKQGTTFMRIAAAQKLLDADPEPENEDSLLSALPQPMEMATMAADEPIPGETTID